MRMRRHGPYGRRRNMLNGNLHRRRRTRCVQPPLPALPPFLLKILFPRANLSQTAARNATATLCKEPVRDKSLTAPIATAVSGALAIGFVALRLYEAYIRKEWQWADACALVALVGFTLQISRIFNKGILTVFSLQISSIPMDVFEFFSTSPEPPRRQVPH